MLSFSILFALTACRSPVVSVKPPACPEYTPQAYRNVQTLTQLPQFRPLIAHLKLQKRQCKAIEAMR
jgi:hypothetical protein